MRRLGILAGLLVIVGLLALGCSKKKDEVAQLEKELLGDSAIADSLGDSVTQSDFVGDDTGMAMDAGAVPEETQPKELPSAPTGSGYTVQVAGCEDRAYAQHLVKVYTDRGFEPFVTNYTVDDQLFYRVRIGQFEGYREATILKAELIDKYSADVWIDQLQ
ncbi:MAG: SPOR domain-containing protein [candidate division Zixibacteria bacterium]|nr:SPOR domain-containing protein [candidate division Zixibacteria bacterium]